MSGHEKNGIPFLVICIFLSAALMFLFFGGFEKIMDSPICRKATLPLTFFTGMPAGGDRKAKSWEEVNKRWVRNYYANGAVTLSDKKTGLMWADDDRFSKGISSSKIGQVCSKLTYAEYSDWSVPNLEQMMVIYEEQRVFKNLQKVYWTSNPIKYTQYAIYMTDGYVTDQITDLNRIALQRSVCSVLPCRSYR